jgi:hypothetical protein
LLGQEEHEALPAGEKVLLGQGEHEALPANSLYVPVHQRAESRVVNACCLSSVGEESMIVAHMHTHTRTSARTNTCMHTHIHYTTLGGMTTHTSGTHTHTQVEHTHTDITPLRSSPAPQAKHGPLV